MAETIYLDLWDENDGIYISFDESINPDIFILIANTLLLNMIVDDIRPYILSIDCEEPSWSDIGDARRNVTDVINKLGYNAAWES